MDEHNGHGDLVKGFYKQQQEVFEGSEQGMYAFLDDDCRVCNEKFARMLGYDSPDEWFGVDVKGAFPEAFVADESQEELVDAYQDAIVSMKGSTLMVSWKKKGGGTVKTMVMLVPVAYEGHVFALHFVSGR